MQSEPTGERIEAAPWSFLSRHGQVLMCLAANPELRLSELAEAVGLSLRAVYPILEDLERGGYISRARHGRCNHYQVNEAGTLRHPLLAGRTTRQLLGAFDKPSCGRPR